MQTHIKDRIEDYLAGTLHPAELRSFEQHVGSCRSCEEALSEIRESQSYLHWLLPLETPPRPGPAFYSNVRRSIAEKRDSGWFGNLAAVLPGPRLAYPLLFLAVGLLLSIWSMTL